MRSIGPGEIIERLRAVPEPCALLLGRDTDIVDMGLVEDIKIVGGHVEITLVLTDTSCVHFTGMRGYIRDVLRRHDAVESVDVRVSTTTVWTPDRSRRTAAVQP